MKLTAKRFLLVSLVFILLTIATISTCYADGYYYGYGTVISTTVSVREAPDTRSTRLYKAKNMDQLVITGEQNGWYIVDLYASGLSTGPMTGYALSKYIVFDGYMIQMSSGSLDVYSDPWSGKCNAEKAQSGEQLFVIYETNEWVVIQLRTAEKTAGSGFIKKRDLGIYDGSSLQFGQKYRFEGGNGYVTSPGTYGTRWMVMYDNDGVSVGIREQPDLNTKKLAIIHSGDIVTVIQNNGEFAYVLYVKPNGQQVYGWVKTKYFVPVDNY